MWDLPGPGLEPVSPTLAGGFLTTAPPGKPGLPFFVGLHLISDLVGDTLDWPRGLRLEQGEIQLSLPPLPSKHPR